MGLMHLKINITCMGCCGMGKSCETCQRFNKRIRQCKVMNELIKDCWAWTDDPDWAKKVKEAVEKYKEMGGGLAE